MFDLFQTVWKQRPVIGASAALLALGVMFSNPNFLGDFQSRMLQGPGISCSQYEMLGLLLSLFLLSLDPAVAKPIHVTKVEAMVTQGSWVPRTLGMALPSVPLQYVPGAAERNGPHELEGRAPW